MSEEQKLALDLLTAVDAETNDPAEATGRQDKSSRDTLRVTGNGSSRKIDLEARNEDETNPYIGLALQGMLEVNRKDATIEFGGEAGVALITLPANSVVLGVRLNIDALVVATTAVKVGVGIATDEDKYGLTADLAKNTKITTMPDWAVVSSAEAVSVFACDTGGDDAGTLDSGTVTAQIEYVTLPAMADAD